MSNTQASLSHTEIPETNQHAQQISSFAWALFFIWVGVAMMAQVPWGSFLLGVGVLILVVQFARWQLDVVIEGFWLACGTILVAAGLWEILDLPWPLAPILLILLGVALLGKAVGGLAR
jgi:hypothetical protein